MIYFAFWFVVFVSIFQLVLAGMIGPAVRVSKRMKLFAIRDQIRFRKIQSIERNLDVSELELLERCVNNGIHLIHHFGLVELLMSKPSKKQFVRFSDPEMAGYLEQIRREVLTCLFVNSIPMLVYLFPLLMTYRASKWLSGLLCSPEKEVASIFPCNYNAV